MTISLDWWLAPGLITVACLVMMYRPLPPSTGDFGYIGSALDAFLRLLWLVPIGFSWAIYFGLRLLVS